MKKQKASKGFGTWSLYLGLLSMLWVSSINGVSIIENLGGKIGLHNPTILSLTVICLTVPGTFFGLKHFRDWGAKVGTILCLGTTLNVVIPLIIS